MMKRTLLLITVVLPAIVLAVSAAASDKPIATKYEYVQVNRFEIAPGVDFPVDYQLAMVEDLVKQLENTKKLSQVMRQGEPLPEGKPVLRITGTVTKFSKGSQAERYLVGFGAGKTVIVVQVKFLNTANELLLDRKVDGKVIIGVMGGKSGGATNGVAKEIVKVAKDKFF
jgi:hypothetical protein